MKCEQNDKLTFKMIHFHATLVFHIVVIVSIWIFSEISFGLSSMLLLKWRCNQQQSQQHEKQSAKNAEIVYCDTYKTSINTPYIVFRIFVWPNKLENFPKIFMIRFLLLHTKRNLYITCVSQCERESVYCIYTMPNNNSHISVVYINLIFSPMFVSLIFFCHRIS